MTLTWLHCYALSTTLPKTMTLQRQHCVCFAYSTDLWMDLTVKSRAPLTTVPLTALTDTGTRHIVASICIFRLYIALAYSLRCCCSHYKKFTAHVLSAVSTMEGFLRPHCSATLRPGSYIAAFSNTWMDPCGCWWCFWNYKCFVFMWI